MDETDLSGQPPDNPNRLRVIRTARTEREINRAARKGFRPLLKRVIPGEKITAMVGIYQNRRTGEIDISGDVRWSHLDADWELAVNYFTYYPYHFPSPFAAYLIPSDLEPGTRVWLEDLIEDIVAVWGNQWNNPRLRHAEATWTGSDFEIHFDPDKDAEIWIG